MSTRQMRGADRALVQMVTKLGYDLHLAEARHRKAVVLSLLPAIDADEAKTQAATYWSCSGRRDAIREAAANTLRVCSAMPPARRREVWAAFRGGWKVARQFVNHGGAL
jgi:hypothetical protein